MKSFLPLTARTPVTFDFLPNLSRHSSGFLLLVLSHLSRPQILNSPKAQFLKLFPLGKLIQAHSCKRICTLVTPKFLSLPTPVPWFPNLPIKLLIWHLSSWLLKLNKSKTKLLTTYPPTSSPELFLISINRNSILSGQNLKVITDSSFPHPTSSPKTDLLASAFKMHGTVTTYLNSPTTSLVRVTVILHLHYCNSLLIGWPPHFHLCPPKSILSVAFLKDRSSYSSAQNPPVAPHRAQRKSWSPLQWPQDFSDWGLCYS